MCATLIGAAQNDSSAPPYLQTFCGNVSNGINTLGLHEVLNFILREEEKVLLNFIDATSEEGAALSADLLYNSTLTEEEALADIFLSEAFSWQRASLIGEITQYANYLFGVFDILFGVFVGALCLATGYLGFVYISRFLRSRIIQIYHIVMLVPYGERTKRELNELIKIDL